MLVAFCSLLPLPAIYIVQTTVGGIYMKGNPEERAVLLAEYIVATNATVRVAAAEFGISKSTVHKDVTQRLRRQNRALYNDVQRVLKINKDERHLRGGLATKYKYHPPV